MIKLYKKDGTTFIGNLDNAIECFVEEERNGLFELNLLYPISCPLFADLEEENIIVAAANDTLKEQKFRIYLTRKSMGNKVEVYARHISFDLAYDYISNIAITNQSCEYALNTIFRSSNFSNHYRGKSDIVNAQDYNISMVNVLEAIGGKEGSILDTFGTGAEILRDNEEISVLNRRGNDNLVSIEYRKNLTGFELQEDTSNLITRILPYAKYTPEGGVETLVIGSFVDSPHINNFSHPYIKHIDYTDKYKDKEVPNVTTLTKFAELEYQNNKVDIPKQNFKIQFIPLSKCVGYEGISDKISLCDIVTIKDSRYSVDTKAKVVKVNFNVLKDRYESMELGEPRTTLGDIISSGGEGGKDGKDGKDGEPGKDGNIGDFPDTLPPIPQLKHFVYGFSAIELSWTFENKAYYSYELYASKTKDFTPNSFDIIHQGQSSSYLFQAQPNETWYFKVCGVNSYGKRTQFSNQVEAKTVKIEDLSNYVKEMAISDALIGDLNLGRGWVGQLNANLLDVKGNFSVTDGNGKRTLDIDSFGNVALDVTSLRISSKQVSTDEENERKLKEAIEQERKSIDGKIDGEVKELNDYLLNMNDFFNGAFKDGVLDEQEKSVLENNLVNLNKEKNDVISQTNTLLATSELQSTAEYTSLTNARNNFTTSHNNLVAKINELISTINPPAPSNEMKIHFIDTRMSGDCILIQYNNKNILIDSNEGHVSNSVIAHLKGAGVSKLDYVIATHHHSDHSGGMPQILDAFNTTGCIAYHRSIDFSKLPPIEVQYDTKGCHDRFVAKCISKGITLKTPTEKERITLSADTYIEFYNTNANFYENYNGFSICTLIVHKNKKYFLSSDICTQMQALLYPSLVQVDVFKAQHHDYDYEMDTRFLDKLNPADTVITNTKKHTDNKLRAVSGYLQERNKRFYMCNGTVILTSNGDSYSFNKSSEIYINAWWDKYGTDNWYYFKVNGLMAKNENLLIDGKVYNFNSTGLCTNPWQ